MNSLNKFITQNPVVEVMPEAIAKLQKGGRRFVTSSYSSFAAKRETLQNKNACMCITHVGGTYCIEW
ncbi:MAG: hypothetical protein AB8B69_03850 [Chitinophagales bacterium]